MPYDNDNCDNNKFDECQPFNKTFLTKLNDVIVGICSLCKRDLPQGSISFNSFFVGFFKFSNDKTNNVYSPIFPDIEVYPMLGGEQVFTVAEYPYLATVGQKINIRGDITFAYRVTQGNSTNNLQFGGNMYVNGVLVDGIGEGFFANQDGNWHQMVDILLAEVLTNGNDLSVRLESAFFVVDSESANSTDIQIDTSKAILQMEKV